MRCNYYAIPAEKNLRRLWPKTYMVPAIDVGPIYEARPPRLHELNERFMKLPSAPSGYCLMRTNNLAQVPDARVIVRGALGSAGGEAANPQALPACQPPRLDAHSTRLRRCQVNPRRQGV